MTSRVCFVKKHRARVRTTRTRLLQRCCCLTRDGRTVAAPLWSPQARSAENAPPGGRCHSHHSVTQQWRTHPRRRPRLPRARCVPLKKCVWRPRGVNTPKSAPHHHVSRRVQSMCGASMSGGASHLSQLEAIGAAGVRLKKHRKNAISQLGVREVRVRAHHGLPRRRAGTQLFRQLSEGGLALNEQPDDKVTELAQVDAIAHLAAQGCTAYFFRRPKWRRREWPAARECSAC